MLAVAGSVAFFLSAAGLPFVIARVVAETGGRLSVEGASGSLASTMHFERLEWHGSETTVTAREVVVEWRALALFSRRLAIRGLGAREIAIAVKPSAGATAPPASLALPLAVTMDHVAVSELDWQAGPRTGKITGLEFGYEGDAIVHRIRGLRFVHEAGALSGDATLQATAPFALEGGVAIVGDGPLAGAKLGTTLSGTLPEIAVDATGTMRAAALTAHIDVTPFAGNAFRAAAITLDNVDLAAFHAALPRTRLKLDLDARPREGGATGTFRAVNGEAGSIDDERLPVAAAAGRYDFATAVLALSDLDVTLAGGAHASGDGRVDLAAADAASRWRLAVRDLDLARQVASG